MAFVENKRINLLRGFVVKEGTRGVLLRNGRYRATLEPGRYWAIPFIDEVKIVNVRPQMMDVPIWFFSRDQYRFTGDLTLFYNISDPKRVALMSPDGFEGYIQRYVDLEFRGELSHSFSLEDQLDPNNPNHLVLNSVDTIKGMFKDRGLYLYDVGMVLISPPRIPQMHMRRLEAEYDRMTRPVEADARARAYTIEATAHRENRLALFRGVIEGLRELDGPSQYIIAMNVFGNNGSNINNGVAEGVSDNLYARLIGDEHLAQVAMRRGLGRNGIAVFSLGDLLNGRG